MSRRTLATGLAAVVVTAAVAVAGAAASGSDISHPQTLRLSARGGSSTFVDTGRHGPSVGDEVILRQPVFEHGRRAGTGRVMIVLEGRDTSQDEVDVTLAAGEITLQGAQNGNRFTLAVTGGTGEYRNARGEARIRVGSNNSARVTIHLIP